MKNETLIKILFDLLANKKVTAAKTAQKYGLSKRTIFRYMDTLSVSGVPIQPVYGCEGGYKISDTYKLPAGYLTEKEYDAVISALKAVNAELPNEFIDSGLTKLTAAVKGEKNGLTLTSGNLIIDAGGWGDTGAYRAKLGAIEKSIEERRVMFIRYHDRTGEVTERLIEPHTIVFKQGLWYVHAYCRLRGGFRLFKTGRIEYADIKDEVFERKPLPENPLKEWYAAAETEDVCFKVEKAVLSDVEEWLGIENVKEENGSYYARARLPRDGGLITKVLAYGAGIKVIYPETLKKEVASAAKKVAEIYE